MNPDVLLGILRAFIPLIVGAATYLGLGNDVQNTAIAGAIAAGIVAAWSAYTNTQAAKIQSVNAQDNGVKVVPITAASASVNAPIPALSQAAKK